MTICSIAITGAPATIIAIVFCSLIGLFWYAFNPDQPSQTKDNSKSLDEQIIAELEFGEVAKEPSISRLFLHSDHALVASLAAKKLLFLFCIRADFENTIKPCLEQLRLLGTCENEYFSLCEMIQNELFSEKNKPTIVRYLENYPGLEITRGNNFRILKKTEKELFATV